MLSNLLALSFVALLCLPSTEASSKRSQPFKRVLAPQSPTIRILRRELNPLTLVKRSLFAQDAQILHTDTLLLRFNIDDSPVSVVLKPSQDLLASDARINYHTIDQKTGLSSVRTVPLLRQDVRAFDGVVVHEADVKDWWNEEAAGLVRVGSDDRSRGWARITIREEDDAWDGAMNIDGQLHHFKPLQSYLRDRSIYDPEPPVSALARRGRVGGATIIAREMDSYSDEDIEGRHHSCSHDSLDFNNDLSNPVYQTPQQIAFDNDGFGLPPASSWLNGLLGHPSLPPTVPAHHPRQFVKRQDIAGGQNSSSSFVNNIGSTAGCPKDQRVLFIGVAADCTAVQSYGSQDAARRQILAEINTVSGLYQRTFNVSVGVVEMNVMDASCPTSVDSSNAWNVGCSGSSSNGVDLNTRLSLFSAWRGNKGGADGAGLWHLLTACNTGQEVGVAWLGQLCRVQASSSQGQSTSGTAVTALTDRTWTVIAHEMGHNFGAVHDCVSGCSGTSQSGSACCPLSSGNCNSGSQYIMSPVSTQNVTDFSPCSVGNVCSVLQSTLNTTCLYTPGSRSTLSTSQCGNGILEPGEECDSGSSDGSSCCTSGCRFTSGSVCDPLNSACCETSCQFSSSSKVCRPSVNSECDQAESCTGSSAQCPDDQTTKDGTSCGTEGQGLKCANGICTSRDLQCREQGSSLGVTRACGGASSNCQVTCQAPNASSSQCIILDSNFADGTSCGLAGRCEGGECQNGPWQEAAASWITNNKQISIPVIVVAGLIILAILYSCIRACFRKSKRNKTAPSAVYADKRSKRNKIAAVVPGMTAANNSTPSPTYAAPTYTATQQQTPGSYPYAQPSPMQNNNYTPAQPTPAYQGAPSYPPNSFASPGGFVPSTTNRQSIQYNAPSGPPPVSPTGWTPNVTSQSRPLPIPPNRTSGGWVDPSAYNGHNNNPL